MFPPSNPTADQPPLGTEPTPDAPPLPNGQPTEPPPDPLGTQLDWPEEERERLMRHIRENHYLARDENQRRMKRCQEQERLWREMVGLSGGEQGKSNFRVQLVTTLLLSKHSREVDALYGGGASVSTAPRGPSDPEHAKRVGVAMTWKVFEQMKAMKPLSVWTLNRLKFGRAFAYVPYRTRYYSKFVNGKSVRVKYKSGAEVVPLDQDETLFPAEDPADRKIEGFSWMIREIKAISPAELLRDEQEAGLYSGIAENWEAILSLAKQGIKRDPQSDQIQIEKDWAQQIQRDGAASIRNNIRVWEWYGRWRPIAQEAGKTESPTEESIVGAAGIDETGGNEDESLGTAGLNPGEGRTSMSPSPDGSWDAPYTDGTYLDSEGIRREMEEIDIVVRIIPEIGNGLIVGIQRLDELFPDSPRKWPILELALLNDNHYWCMGVVELAQEIEKEMTVLINMLIESGQFGIKPLIFYEPAMAGSFETFKYEPGQAIPKAAGSKIDVVSITSNPEVAVILLNFFKEQYGDLLGITATALGRGYSQPNAGKTLGQTRLMMGAADVRLALDMKMLAEDLKEFLEWVWNLWTMFGTEDQYFRVAEGKSQGLFRPTEVSGGFVAISAEERHGFYDFSMEFADDMQVREGKKQEALALIQAAMMTTIVQQDPVAQYRLLVDLFSAFNLDFTKYAKEPPPMFTPRTPEQEWTMALEGQDIHVHPQDNDAQHEQDHEERIVSEKSKPPEEQDGEAIARMMDHIIEHRQAAIQKQQMAALQGMITQAVQGAMGPGGMGQPGGGGNPLQALMGGTNGGAQPGMPTNGGMPQGMGSSGMEQAAQ